MNRRDFIGALGVASAWPLSAGAQQKGAVRLGIIMPGAENDPQEAKNASAFRDGMRKLGWAEDSNVRFDFRWQAARPERAQAAVAELLAIPCDVIVVGTIQAFLALRRSSSNVPVIFVNLPDPVATGLVSTIAQTNGNFTGFTAYEYSIAGKWLEVLKDIVPKIRRVGFVFGTVTAPVGENFYHSLEAKAPALDIEAVALPFTDSNGLELNIKTFASQPNGGLIMAAEGGVSLSRAEIIKLAQQYNLPAVYPFRNIPTEGGLAFYGIDFVDLWARAPSYVDRVLRGAKLADLPIQAPTRFDLVINLSTAKALGLTLPPSLLARADEVIE
jgi:ABC-type uncharacterized transport system substrate-binding protein